MRRWASATSGWWATNSLGSSPSPSRAGRPSSDHAAPGPHACMTTVPSPRRDSRGRRGPVRGRPGAPDAPPVGRVRRSGRPGRGAAGRGPRPGRRGRPAATRGPRRPSSAHEPVRAPVAHVATQTSGGEPHPVRRQHDVGPDPHARAAARSARRRPRRRRPPRRDSVAPSSIRAPAPTIDCSTTAPGADHRAVEEHRAVQPGARADRDAAPDRRAADQQRVGRDCGAVEHQRLAGRAGQRRRRRDAADQVGRAAHEVRRACPCRASRRRRRARTPARPPPAAPGTSRAPPTPAGPSGIGSITARLKT